MRITVLGAGGRTGRHLVAQALAAGHNVTAVVRRRGPGAEHTRLRPVTADVLDPASLPPVFEGADAVLSAIGSSRPGQPTEVYSAGITAIIAGMHTVGVRRLLGITALPVAPATEHSRLQYRVVHPLLFRLFGTTYQDMQRMEAALAASDRDWTVFRPPYLREGPATGRYRTAVDAPLPRAWSLHRADLASAMLAAVPDERLVGHAVNVAA